MAVRTESRLMVGSDIDDVWAYLCDVARWPEWAPTVRSCRILDGAAFAPGATIAQQARGVLGMGYPRTQRVTVAEAPRRMGFAGPMGTSSARWGMELATADPGRTVAMMWVEVDMHGVMRAIPERMLQARVQRVSDREMVAIKGAVEATDGHDTAA